MFSVRPEGCKMDPDDRSVGLHRYLHACRCEECCGNFLRAFVTHIDFRCFLVPFSSHDVVSMFARIIKISSNGNICLLFLHFLIVFIRNDMSILCTALCFENVVPFQSRMFFIINRSN